MFDWLRRRRRQQLVSQPTSATWTTLLTGQWFWPFLTNREREEVVGRTKIFVAEKNWEGCGGLAMSEEIQVTIAAQMAWVVLGLADQYFDRVLSILVYPDAYVAPHRESTTWGGMLEGEHALEGQAWYRGPVILSWRDVRRGARGPNGGRNVVVHEFAHQLDMLNGPHVDGVPVIESNEFAERWLQLTQEEFENLQRRCQGGFRTLFDCYGATSREEFFAVASEVFFQRGAAFQSEHPDLYRLFTEFYRQDPAARTTAMP